MKLKPLYNDRVKTLKTQINNAEDYVKARQNSINQHIESINNILSELKAVSSNENIEPNIKYIQLNEKATDIEKITSKIEVLYQEIKIQTDFIDKGFSILIQSCIDDHSNYKEEDIISEIKRLLGL